MKNKCLELKAKGKKTTKNMQHKRQKTSTGKTQFSSQIKAICSLVEKFMCREEKRKEIIVKLKRRKMRRNRIEKCFS